MTTTKNVMLELLIIISGAFIFAPKQRCAEKLVIANRFAIIFLREENKKP